MTRIIYFAELRQQRAYRRWYLDQSQRCFGGDAKGSFRADESSQQIIARRLHSRAAKIEDFAAGKYDAASQDVIGCRTVLETMNSACTFGNVAANSASRLTGRIWNVIQAERRDRSRDLQVNYSRLHYGETVGRIYFEDLAHARHLDHDALIKRQGAAR